MNDIPNPLVVEVDLSRLGLMEYGTDGEPVGPADLREQIIERAAHKLLTEWDHDSRRAFRERVQQIRDEEIRAALTGEIHEALGQPIQLSTPWGDKKGEPVTVRELIRLELEKFLGGKKTTHNSFSTDKAPQNLADLISEVTKEAMRTEFSQDIRKAKEAVTTQVSEIAVETTRQLLAGKKAR